MDDKEIASQLRKPHGEQAGKVSEEMSRKNCAMIFDTIDLLNLKESAHILEIGFGSGRHIHEILEKNKTLTYSGIDISGAMVKEAEERCQQYVESGRVILKHTDGDSIPFQESLFNCVFSVNTLYFWDDVPGYLREIHRVMEVNSRLLLTFATKRFLQSVSFAKHGFNCYSREEVEHFLDKSGFKPLEYLVKKEQVESADGRLIEREYAISESIRI